MKLKKLIVSNFRGLKGDKNIISFENSDIIFLIGQNNVGKSSLLDAYDFFITPNTKPKITDFNDHKITNKIEIIGEFLFDKSDEEDADLIGSAKDKDPKWMEKWVDKENIVKIKKCWDQPDEKGQKYTFDPRTSDWVKNGFGGFDSILTKHAPQTIFIKAMEEETTLEEKVNKIINEEFLKKAKDDFPDKYNDALLAIKELQKLILSSGNIYTYNNQINQLFKNVFPELTLELNHKNQDEINLVEAIKKHHSVGVKTVNASREETFLEHGHGVIRQALFNFIAFLGKLKAGSTKKDYIILYEEPEVFLHPKVVYKLRKSLYDLSQNSPYQVLCATHSSLMIDISKPHSSLVRVVKDENQNSATYQVGDDVFQNGENKNVVQMINRFNSNICECFYADKVLLVEGDTEAIIFRELLERYFSEHEIYVLNTGSKNNIPFFQEVLTHFRIKHYVIHDTDTPSKKSSWTLNEKIWRKVESAHKIQTNLSRRYVFKDKFESAHEYEENDTDGKPLSAFKFVTNKVTLESNYDCINFLKDVVGEQKINHDQHYIQKKFKEDVIPSTKESSEVENKEKVS